MTVSRSPSDPSGAFFVAGGTVPPDAPSYVERGADRELFEALLSGEYCYVLNSRQMGKSSLAVRTIRKLNEAGVRTAFVDLTKIGGTTSTPEQWYAGLMLETGRALGLRNEAVVWLRDHQGLGPAQRYLSFLQEIAASGERPTVLMVDEIDATRSLPFSADELFAGIRQLHNGRASDPALRNLTFCLLGAALPGDLIRDARITPFNVGRRIELRDFTLEEAEVFAEPLAPRRPHRDFRLSRSTVDRTGAARVREVMEWTGGHPFLTQSLCADLASDPNLVVASLVRARYLDARARDADSNLADVGNRLLGKGDPDVGEKEVSDTLSLYAKLLKGDIADDEANPAAARIKMSGVARLENGRLTVRNRIYARVFDAAWVRENMPGQELRRQRMAFWKGALRTGAIAAAVIATVGTLAFSNYRMANETRVQRDQARYDAYVASMQTMVQKRDEDDVRGARRTLDALAGSPSRGWEWRYWEHSLFGGEKVLDWKGSSEPKIAARPNGEWIAVADSESVSFFRSAGEGRRRIRLPRSVGSSWNVNAFRRGDRFFLHSPGTGDTLVIDAASGRVLRQRRVSGWAFGLGPNWDSEDDCWTLVVQPTYKVTRLDLDTLEETEIKTDLESPEGVWFAPGGALVALRGLDGGSHLSIRRTPDLGLVARLPTRGGTCANFSPSGKTVALLDDQELKLIDVQSRRILSRAPFPYSATEILFSPDGLHLLVSRTGARSALEYDLRTGKLLEVGRYSDVQQGLYLADGVLVSGESVRRIERSRRVESSEIRVPGGPYFLSLDSYRGKLSLISPGKQVIVSKDEPGRVLTETKILEPNCDNSARFGIRVEKDLHVFIDRTKRVPTFSIPAPRTTIWLAWGVDPEGRYLVSTIDNGHVGVYEVGTGRLLRRLAVSEPASICRFSEDDKWLAIGGALGQVEVWKVDGWRPVASGRVTSGDPVSIAFSEDGKKLVACGTPVGLGTLDLTTGRALPFTGNVQVLNSAAWSHDGTRIATTGSNFSVRIWDAATGRDLGVIGRQDSAGFAVWFLPGDRTLCSIDRNGIVKLWQTEDRR